MITSCLKKNGCGVCCVSRYTCLKSISHRNRLSLSKPLKDSSFPFFRYTDGRKQGAIGLMTAGESRKGVSSSALRAANNCDCPRCTGLWQMLICSSPQPQRDMHRGSSGEVETHTTGAEELLMALKWANKAGHQLSTEA